MVLSPVEQDENKKPIRIMELKKEGFIAGKLWVDKFNTIIGRINRIPEFSGLMLGK